MATLTMVDESTVEMVPVMTVSVASQR
jgi:hypothetical protein